MTQQINNTVTYENYRKIACVSLNKYSLYNDFMLQSQLTSKLYNSKKNKTTLQFYNADSCNDVELSYLCRSVDIVIFLVAENNFCSYKMSLIVKNIPSYIFCCLDDNIKFTKKYVENIFNGDIVKIWQLIDKLCSIKIQNTKIYCNRPSFLVDEIRCESDKYFYAKAMIRNNLNGNKIIVNGIEKFEIVEINNSAIEIIKYNEDEIFEEKINENDINDNDADDDMREDTNTNKYEDMDVEEDTEDLCKSNKNDDMDIDEESNNICSETDLIGKYKDYCTVKNMKTSTFVTKEYPKYYQGITLFENIIEVERRLAKKTNKIDNKYIECELKLKRLTNNLDLNNTSVYVCYNVYDFEDKLTVYNMEFNCTEEIQTNSEYIADFGHFILPIIPMITSISNGNLHKCIQRARSGVISFIAPLTIDLNRVLLFKDSYFIGNYIGQATNNNYKERVILEEVNIVGKAKKIDKRYCTVMKMFNNKEEVLYYRNMPLVCSNGNTGIIKKPIGTYGLYKAYFSKPVTHADNITIKLYKRIFPQMPNKI